jgi:membrane protease YdiL (CAAX protease family)
MLMIAILPAIGEEFMFRGLIQRLLKDWLGNIHLAIFISALLFSAMHMQFYGFFPRMVLGIMFGYMFYWTGSLWIPIFAHFIQNGLVVTVTYLGQQGIIGGDYENFGSTDNFLVILVSLLISAIILFILRKRW